MTSPESMLDGSAAPRALDRRRLLRLGALGGASVLLAACESLQDIPQLFERRQAPLPGDRRPVFPEGVPGIDRSIGQPANAPPDAVPPPEQPRRGR